MLRIVQRILYVLLAASFVLFCVGLYLTRTLRQTDGPTIAMDSDRITVSVKDGRERLLQGVSAHDEKDGDVSESLVVQGMSNFIEKGRRQATIAAFDSDNNVAKVTREILYTDYVSPRFSLVKPLRFPIGTQETTIMQAVRATDCLDGDLSANITVELEGSNAELDTMAEGTFRLIYTVVNSAGDVAELPVTVQIYSSGQYNRALQLRLRQNLVYLSRGASFDPADYVERMEKDGESVPLDWDRIQIYNPVNTAVPGVYEVLYSIEEEGGDVSFDVRLPVIVE